MDGSFNNVFIKGDQLIIQQPDGFVNSKYLNHVVCMTSLRGFLLVTSTADSCMLVVYLDDG